MATIAFNSATALRQPAKVADSGPTWLQRLSAAIYESRRRRVAIELRRHGIVLDDADRRFDYALLPFAGE